MFAVTLSIADMCISTVATKSLVIETSSAPIEWRVEMQSSGDRLSLLEVFRSSSPGSAKSWHWHYPTFRQKSSPPPHFIVTLAFAAFAHRVGRQTIDHSRWVPVRKKPPERCGKARPTMACRTSRSRARISTGMAQIKIAHGDGRLTGA